MREIVFFLEERSARELLRILAPKLLPEGVHGRFIVFEGKQDLERQLVRRMRGYLNPDAAFIVLRDQDAGDCRQIKERLLEKCAESGRKNVLVRIACREIESWYLADLKAVENGLEIPNLHRQQNKEKFRAPDRLKNPKRELIRLTDDKYQTVGGSRAIAAHLDVDNARSPSFAMLISAIKRLAER